MFGLVSRKRYNAALDALFERNHELSSAREQLRLVTQDRDEYRTSFNRAEGRNQTLAAQVQRLTALVPQRGKGGKFIKRVGQ